MAFTHSLKFPTVLCSFRPRKPHLSAGKHQVIPATDRVIDFGKYKGKMLGSLPSTYLKWVSKNLRAGYSEEWAKLADQVLEDPVYQDRLEWEFADSVLKGNKDESSSRDESVVSQWLEVSERFGWDNEDKIGWSKVNFGLLGTSKGGRIPRRNDVNKEGKELTLQRGDRILSESEMRRKKRRERSKMKKKREEADKLGNIPKIKDSFVIEEGSDCLENTEIKNPFPGREGFLKTVLNKNPY